MNFILLLERPPANNSLNTHMSANIFQEGTRATMLWMTDRYSERLQLKSFFYSRRTYADKKIFCECMRWESDHVSAESGWCHKKGTPTKGHSRLPEIWSKWKTSSWKVAKNRDTCNIISCSSIQLRGLSITQNFFWGAARRKFAYQGLPWRRITPQLKHVICVNIFRDREWAKGFIYPTNSNYTAFQTMCQTKIPKLVGCLKFNKKQCSTYR